VDDDVPLLHLIKAIFSEAGAEVYTAEGGPESLELLAAHSPELVILDVMMPDMDGFETCARIQERSRVPIIFLTALGLDEEIVRGLESGAIDYVTKPFSSRVLLARARAALRQADLVNRADTQPLYDDGYLRIDLVARRVFVQEEAVQLTPLEFGLLVCLYQHAGRVVPYDEILDSVWGEVYRDSVNYVHVYVRYLRQKLEPIPRSPQRIITERGEGYMLRRLTVEG
jgi:DNA-binding response OmpR family regulator